jgi:hypothetical protein
MRFFSFISVKVTPDIKEIYPGTSGKTQGDKKEINPAAKAMYKEISDIFYRFHLLQFHDNWLVCKCTQVQSYPFSVNYVENFNYPEPLNSEP